MEEELIRAEPEEIKAGKRVSMVHIEMVREERSLYIEKPFTDAKGIADMVRPLLLKADREMFIVISLDVKLVPVAAEVVAVGGLSSCYVDIRNIFKHAILSNADRLICIHNHPTGNPQPSREDILYTKRIMRAGEFLGICLIDHIIIGRTSFYSLKEHGDMD